MTDFKFNPDKSTDVDGEDTGITNGTRAASAEKAVGAYMIDTGCRNFAEEDYCTDVQDLLTDLLHLCDREGIDVDDILTSARARWEEER